MKFVARGEYLGVSSRAVNDRVYYNVSILQDMESVIFGCSADVYAEAAKLDRSSHIELEFSESVRNGRTGAFVSRYATGINIMDQ